jgi:murein L,D-transpeptidase YafK
MRARPVFAALALLLAGAGRAAAREGAVDMGLAPPAPVADHIVVRKAARTLTLYAEGQVLREFRGIQLGPRPQGGKQVEGDGRTPEGHYLIDQGNPASSYHLSLHVSYPDQADRARAAALGKSPGGAIYLHGQPNDWAGPGRVDGDWTQGCIALANDEIEAIWRLVPDGTPIDITP